MKKNFTIISLLVLICLTASTLQAAITYHWYNASTCWKGIGINRYWNSTGLPYAPAPTEQSWTLGPGASRTYAGENDSATIHHVAGFNDYPSGANGATLA